MFPPPRRKKIISPRSSRPGAIATESTDEFLTTPETAALLKRSVKTLEYWRVMRRGPRFYKQNRGVRYLKSEVLEWATRQAVDTKDSAA
jgi:hypothetical protein